MAKSRNGDQQGGVSVALANAKTQLEAPETIVVEVPVEDISADSYRPSGRTHIDVQLTASAGRALRQVQSALMSRNAKLASGRVVHTRGDVIHWLFQQIADAPK